MPSHDFLPEALLDQYLTGDIQEEDRQRLMDWFEAFDDEQVVVPTSSKQAYVEVADRIWNGITVKMGRQPKAKRVNIYRYGWVAAACMAALIVGGLFLWKKLDADRGTAKVPQRTALGGGAIIPGHNGAVLTLSNGSKLTLDGRPQAEIAPQGQAKVILNGDSVVYSLTTKRPVKAAAVAYNTMTTPRGRQFSLILPDGTKVWLNASSSITYPVSFGSMERIVSLTGEAYFEVAHLKDPATNTKIPFKVKAGGMQIQVLGTHFDVSNYSDEPAVKTSLLEGSVSVSLNYQGKPIQIRPGQQAALFKTDAENIKVKQVNLAHVMAWKSGFFSFENDQLEDILRQISRWYNVDVECADSKKHLRFNGVISKRAEVQDLLNLLSATGVVTFKIKGDHITAY